MVINPFYWELMCNFLWVITVCLEVVNDQTSCKNVLFFIDVMLSKNSPEAQEVHALKHPDKLMIYFGLTPF